MLSEQQIERYSRQIILPEVGGRGQQRLLSAAVAIAGSADMGGAACAYLVAAGVGHIEIVGGEAVATSDLAALNPDCQVSSHNAPLSPETADRLACDYDIVIAANVDPSACELLNTACVAQHTHLLWARVRGFTGQIASFAGHDPQRPCYGCVAAPPTDARAGGFALTAGVLGTMLATETIKHLLGVGSDLDRRRLTYDALTMVMHEEHLEKNTHCRICRTAPEGPVI